MVSVLFDAENHATNDNVSVSDDHITIIDSFFESLNLTEENKPWEIDEEIPLGQLMSKLDTSNRWVYNGKLSTPPCNLDTYYNVLSIVYPIKAEHLALVKAHIAEIAGTPQNGNWRATQALTNQNP